MKIKYSTIVAMCAFFCFSSIAAAPPRTTNFFVTIVGSQTLGIAWSIPEITDGTTIVSNDFRISTSPITTLKWNSYQRLSYLDNAVGTPGVLQYNNVTNLVESTFYYIGMKTRNNLGQWSSISKILTAETTSTDRIVHLVWDPNSPSDQIIAYKVYMVSNGVTNSPVDVGNVTRTPITVTGGVSYQFFVTAYSDVGESDPSDSVYYVPPL